MKFKKRVLRAIHEIGGCDAADEWSKGYDDGVNDAYKVIDELTEEDPRIWQIANHYGFTSQANMLTEEAAEFTVALNKLRRGSSEAYEQIKEEVADSLVIALQLRLLLGADEIDEIMDEKIDRQLERIQSEGETGIEKGSFNNRFR